MSRYNKSITWSEQIRREMYMADKNYWTDLCEMCGIGIICIMFAIIVGFIFFG